MNEEDNKVIWVTDTYIGRALRNGKIVEVVRTEYLPKCPHCLKVPTYDEKFCPYCNMPLEYDYSEIEDKENIK